jgi:hypothetical protein
VAVKWVLYEPGHVQALRLLEEELSGSLMLIAPDLLLTEFASLIAKRVRRKHMSAAEAIDAFYRFEESVPALFETRPLVEAALNLAVDGQNVSLGLRASRPRTPLPAHHFRSPPVPGTLASLSGDTAALDPRFAGALAI